VSQLGSAPVSATLQVVYLGLFPTTLGFTTWAYALARTTSGRMGATIYAVPTLVIIMSWLILGQVPRWLAVGGGALCLAGVAISRSRPSPDFGDLQLVVPVRVHALVDEKRHEFPLLANDNGEAH
jgi:drug/metabolite transporter (DMT)-like permease